MVCVPWRCACWWCMCCGVSSVALCLLMMHVLCMSVPCRCTCWWCMCWCECRGVVFVGGACVDLSAVALCLLVVHVLV